MVEKVRNWSRIWLRTFFLFVILIVGSMAYTSLIAKKSAAWARDGAILPDKMILAINVGRFIQNHYVLLVPVMFAIAFVVIFLAETPKRLEKK